jgi:hypothetical protein
VCKSWFEIFVRKSQAEFPLCILIKVGGLDLSRRDLDRDLDLDVKKKSVSTVEIFSTSFKNWSRRPKVLIFVEISIEISISTPKKSQSRPSRKSRQVLKTGLDAMDVLDLDWSRLSRPPSLILIFFSFYLLRYFSAKIQVAKYESDEEEEET